MVQMRRQGLSDCVDMDKVDSVGVKRYKLNIDMGRRRRR